MIATELTLEYLCLYSANLLIHFLIILIKLFQNTLNITMQFLIKK